MRLANALLRRLPEALRTKLLTHVQAENQLVSIGIDGEYFYAYDVTSIKPKLL
jgi:hypothetical protein